MAFTEKEARAQFPTLVELACQGETVVIEAADGRRIEMVPVAQDERLIKPDLPEFSLPPATGR